MTTTPNESRAAPHTGGAAPSGSPFPAPPGTMRAIVHSSYGSADTLRCRTIARPHPTSTQVLLRVHAAGVTRGTWHLMTGLPYLVRLSGFGLRRPKSVVLGQQVAGRVVAAGSQVARLRQDDEVFGVATGSFAEYAVAEEDQLVKRPAQLTTEQAAVTPVPGVTALQALTDVGGLRPGQRVLIIGASGGVGVFAVQLAKVLGAQVTAVAGPAKQDLVRSLGADEVLDYTRDDFSAAREPFDLIVDLGGRNSLRRLRAALGSSGTLVIVGGEGGNRFTGGVGRQLRALVLSRFATQRLTTFLSDQHYARLERLTEYLRTGQVVPVVGSRYPLANTADALKNLDSADSRGNPVLVIEH